MGTNDITGDKIATKPATDAYRDHYDAIFRKEDQIEGWPMIDADEDTEPLDWPEDDSRIDQIGQNGGDGAHYAAVRL